MPTLAEAPESTTATDEAAPGSGAPASTEPVASPAPAATTEAAPVAATDAPARTRDPVTGRFIKADGSQVSDAEQATLETKANADAEPAPVPAPTAATPAAPTPATVNEPFVFRADGKRIPIPGSAVSPEGHLTIPVEQVPAIRQLLSEGLAHRGSWQREMAASKQALADATAAGKAQADKYNGAALYLFDTLKDLLGDDPRMGFIQERLDIMLQRADLTIPKVAAPPTNGALPEQARAEQAALEQAATEALEEELEALLDSPQARAIYATPEERKAVLARHVRRIDMYFVEQEGGGLALDRHALRDDFTDDLAVREQGRKAVEEARKAATFNATRATPAVVAPVVKPAGPGGTGGATGRVFKDKEEYRKAMGLP